MFVKLLKNFFGTSNDRTIKSLQPIVDQINELESDFEKLSDNELKAKTEEFKSRLATGSTLDSLLPEAFAVVREASKRVLNMRHFDVQLIGGIVLHRGMICEMKTGEGKTLMATLPIYLNALTGKGVHLVTVNDYLVKRDSEEMGKIYNFLGLTVGAITSSLSEEAKKQAYDSDITYGTNNEFGFDYLRDNLKYSTGHIVQRKFNFAIVDEVDSILIDEARTPLIISGPTEDNSELYVQINKLFLQLKEEDFEVDAKSRNVMLTDKGNEHVEHLLKADKIIDQNSFMYDLENMSIVHHVNQALKAHHLFNRDRDYIVKDNEVKIVDEFTGRIMDGRRYSEGLHQALEAKENISIQNENQTLASITFQNYFRMYPKLAGMTGTAVTEAHEFLDIYKLEVATIPTNVAVQRKDEDDNVYLSAEEKYHAIIDEIERVNKTGQPILVGTASIEKSEYLSSLLKKKNIRHNVLNARYHEQEAYIIAQAGRTSTVTIATNMAGRGTDIMLGGNAAMQINERVANSNLTDEKEIEKIMREVKKQVAKDKQQVIELGGLFILGTERHESRRIDNQLRGRSGRQGDPGRTKFYLSLEDDLMKIFGSDKMKGLLTKIGVKEGEVLTHPWISKSLEKAQQKVEARNYDTRKTLLKFDDVINEQRKVIYEQRKFFMEEGDLRLYITDISKELADDITDRYIAKNSLPEEWDIEALIKEAHKTFNLKLDLKEYVSKDDITEKEVLEFLQQEILSAIDHKFTALAPELILAATRQLLILTLDQLWKEHLHVLDHLRTGIGLRAYAQKDPLNEYKIEAFKLFKTLMDDLVELILQRFFHLEIAHDRKEIDITEHRSNMVETRIDPALALNKEANSNEQKAWGKVARNELCPCSSGKKYKHCHGSIA